MTKFTDYRWLALFFGAFFFLSGCQAGLAGTDQRIYPETYGLLVSSLDQQEMTMDLDLNSPGVQKYVSGPLPQGLDNDACLFFFWDFDIPDFFKNTPLLLFVPATPYPLEIRVNGYLVFSSGVMNSNTRLDKYYGEREFISRTILNLDGRNRLTIKAVPRKIRTALPKIFMGKATDVSSKTVWYSIGQYSLPFGFSLLSFFSGSCLSSSGPETSLKI